MPRKPFIADPIYVGIGPSAKQQQPQRRQKPLKLPESRLHIPKTRELPEEEMWNEKCSLVPNKQAWGVVLISPVPNCPGNKFSHFVMVFLGAHKTEAKAIRMRADAISLGGVAAIFELGFWHVLPVPIWITDENEAVEYNKKAIIHAMKYEKKKTLVRQEIMKRRQKQKIAEKVLTPKEEAEAVERDTLTSPPPVPSVTLSLVPSVTLPPVPSVTLPPVPSGTLPLVPGVTLRPVPIVTLPLVPGVPGVTPPLVPGVTRPLVPGVTPPLVPGVTRPLDPEPSAVVNYKQLVPKKQRIGLAWVLPHIQSPNQEFENICINWIGAFSNVKQAVSYKDSIEKKYPEWTISQFELGDKVELPVRTWLFAPEQIHYTQDMMIDFMHKVDSSEYISPEEVERRLAEDEKKDKPPDKAITDVVDSLFGSQ